MGKVSQKSIKYLIEAELKALGVVEKPDVVGAIFGQTEGLLGEELDLRTLQKQGKIGRINVTVKSDNGKSKGTIKIPTSLDAADTSLIAASLETIERIGPTDADISVNGIKDQRVSKRDYIVKRAKQLLNDLNSDSPDHQKINEEVKKEVRAQQITEYRGFDAGPEVEKSGEIVLVEGKSDLKNLLKNGVKNCLAMGGTSVPEAIESITQKKKSTAFVDGDRGGELIIKELRQKAEIDYVSKAPEGKEVEELSGREIHSCLRDKKPLKHFEQEDVEKEEVPKDIKEKLEDLIGTRAVYLLNEDMSVEERMPADNFEINGEESCEAVLMDGEIGNKEVRKAEELDASYIGGMEKGPKANSSQLKIFTRKNKAENDLN